MKHIQKLIPKIALAAVLITSCSTNNGDADAYGNFEAVEITVSAEGNGKLMQFNLEEGMQLDSGNLVGIIDTIEIYLSKQQVEAQYKAVKSKVENVLSQIEIRKQQKENLLIDKRRIEKLLIDNAATQKQLDDINGTIDVIDKQIASIKTQNASILNELEALEKQIEQIDEKITKCHVVNPIPGTVIAKYAEEKEIATLGKPLYKIANMKEMILRAYISGSQLSSVKLGQKVKVMIDKNDNELTEIDGNVIWVSQNAEFTPKIIQTREERVNMVYAIKILVNNNGSLKIGMPGEVVFSKD